MKHVRGFTILACAAFVLGLASGPVFFKSCGWGGWDLAAARCMADPSA